MEDEYILSELVDLTDLVRNSLNSKIKVNKPNEIYFSEFFLILIFPQFLAFDVSQSYLIFGANSSSLYIFKRNPYQFERIIPSQKFSSIDKICISHNESIVAFSSKSGKIGFLDLENNAQQTVQIQHESTVSSMYWNPENKQLYVGDVNGNVSVCNISYFMVRILN